MEGSDGRITAFVSLAGVLCATQEPVLFITAGVRKRSAPGGAGTPWQQSIRRKACARAPDQARQVAYCATLATHQSGQTVQPQHRPLCQSTLARNTPCGGPALDTGGLPQWQRAAPQCAARGPWCRHSGGNAAARRRRKKGTNHANCAMPCLQGWAATAKGPDLLAVEPPGPSGTAPNQSAARPPRHTDAGQAAQQPPA